MSETIVQLHKNNFNTLLKAAKSGDLVLMDCRLKSTGESVAVIAAISYDQSSKEYVLTPFAMFFNGNPYEMLEPPNPKGGYHED